MYLHFYIFCVVITETPILGSRLPLRRDTVKHALEHHLDNIERGRKQSKMQTLGASNPHNNNKEKHRTAARVTGDTVDKIFQVAEIVTACFIGIKECVAYL